MRSYHCNSNDKRDCFVPTNDHQNHEYNRTIHDSTLKYSPSTTMSGRGNCTEVTPECPVSATIYGYRPNLPVDATICAIFALLATLQLGSICCLRIRTWSYMITLLVGTAMEIAGYVGRLIMYNNPWNTVGTSLQLICLIVAPSFMAAAISVTFKHIIVYCGAKHSLMRPRFIPLVIIGSDFLGIIVQFVGAAILATAIGSDQPSQTTTDLGNDIIVFGVAFQVFVMVGAGGFMLLFWNRFRKARGFGSEMLETPQLTGKKQYDCSSRAEVLKFKQFCWAVIISFGTIFVRCIYRQVVICDV